ncbi:MAG: tRNA uridine(34) 5-carboxymethylaminomethyl modification radical enzyme Elp3, partial [Patescibacteria group bacterium]|nr:tRNA uridine(34) 5-carboxymethylaminomethyl modification radical enzyme Elp3 [Patescibacteria group bacterium]
PEDVPTEYSVTLALAEDRNSRAENRVIGMAVETRPDLVTREELAFFRECGITRVEIGYQTTVDEINFATGRGHGNAESVAATRMLKDAGFKVVAHMMPNLPGSNPDIDRQSFFRIWTDADFRPDEIKIYPTVVVGNSALERLWKAGKFESYPDDTLVSLMVDLEAAIPEYARLNRAYRDIPASEILAGSKMANLRQVTETEMRARGEDRHDVSAREVRDKKNDPNCAVLEVFEYEASGGREFFLQFVDPSDRTLFSVLRLRIPSWVFDAGEPAFDCLAGAAIIREIHTFGDQMGIGEGFSPAAPAISETESMHEPERWTETPTRTPSQHRGFGKRLIEEAESIVTKRFPQLDRIAVIAGVGAREYYRKRGFSMTSLGYMEKILSR